MLAVQEPVKLKPPAIQPSPPVAGPSVFFAEPRLRRFSLAEFQQLIALGFFEEDERVELLDGLVVEMSPINPRHAECIDNLSEVFHALLLKRARIRIQSPVSLEGRTSQPQPDLTIAVRRPEGYADRHMTAQEIFLLVEVAESSLHTDQTDKLTIYAAVGIKEYWIVNLIDNQLEVYQEPFVSASGEGSYKVKRTYSHDETVTLQAFPDCQIPLSEILPKNLTDRSYREVVGS